MHGATKLTEYATYYKEKLAEGQEYQDFVVDMMYQIGIPIVVFGSRRYQFERGESIAGIEIKHDGQYEKTGNLYIETAEKSDPGNPAHIASGIYRDDNSWLFVIGNRTRIFVFSITMLRIFDAMEQGEKPRFIHTGIATSRGFLLPGEAAERYSALVIDVVDSKPVVVCKHKDGAERN